ncbi:hypothetical protein M0Q28_04075 [Patescibacteria group bacterium]|jgi:hypothetical protein|nr:hypothetical protein [Patescibacteria group bacterium]
MKSFLKKLAFVVCGVMAAMLLMMCGPPSMGMMGDAMVDVGMTLRDGSDTSMPDAMAQDCATDCTGGGVLRVMTADSDPERHVGGFGRLGAASIGDTPSVDAGNGPLVLTDLVSHGYNATDGIFNVVAYSLPLGTPCMSFFDDLNRMEGDVEILASSMASTHTTPEVFQQVHGASALVPSDRHLCIGSRYGGLELYHWSGYRPYD